MQADLIKGLVLLLIGMTSVFAILSLIVLAGRLLILTINKMSIPQIGGADVGEDEMVVIASIVHSMTQGKGHVVNITQRKEET